MIKLRDPNLQLALALVGIRGLSYMSRLTRWNVGFPGREGIAPSADTVKDVFYNQALNTFFNFGARAFPALEEGFAPNLGEVPVSGSDLPWNPARLEQRKGRIDRIGQLAAAIDILNLRYRGSVEDEVHSALSSRLQQIRSIFGTIPDTLEDVWVATALGEIEEARRRISEVPSRHPFDLRYAQDLPETAWERCAEVLDHYDVLRVMKQPW
jgi:hypothetical protein